MLAGAQNLLTGESCHSGHAASIHLATFIPVSEHRLYLLPPSLCKLINYKRAMISSHELTT